MNEERPHFLSNSTIKEETLDPGDWTVYRKMGHKMIDDMVDFLQTIRDQPVWRKPTREVKSFLNESMPENGMPLQDIYQEFLKYILPYRKGNIHPRFYSWVHGTGTFSGALADFLAGIMNSNLAIGDHGAVYVERQILNWCKEMVGFPQEASGILVSGGSVANITALIVARNAFEETIKEKGLRNLQGQLVLYCSVETHNCIFKAAEILGIGSAHLKLIPVDESYQIDMSQLEQQVFHDRQKGLLPFCVVANAGTVNTGAFDPLNSLAAFCKQEKLWFHIDAAIGAVIHLIKDFQKITEGMEKADSIAFDLHKWLYINYDAGCVLVRNSEQHRKAFVQPAHYLSRHERGLAAGPDAFTNYGLELSRGFRALKVWMSLKEHGLNKYKYLIQQNLNQAQYAGSQIINNPLLELLAPVTLNIVCFRYHPENYNLVQLNELNKEIVMRIQERGLAAPSYTFLKGQYAIRMSITNHRTLMSDIDFVLKHVLLLGNEIEMELKNNEYKQNTI